VSRTNVGDRYVIERMLAEGATLGGESSGHIICSEISPTGDGLVAALKVIEVMLETGKPLSELRQGLRKFPQLTSALRVQEKKPVESLPGLSGAIRALEGELGTRGRVLVRFSGTEAKLRLLVEGPNDAVVRDGLSRLETAARAELKVL
jgi:phosphoglucosamine mutase